jgi:hypothetical protein
MQTYVVVFLNQNKFKFLDRTEGCKTVVKVIFQDGDREQIGKQVRKGGKRKEELKNKVRKMRSFGKIDFDGECCCKVDAHKMETPRCTALSRAALGKNTDVAEAAAATIAILTQGKPL